MTLGTGWNIPVDLVIGPHNGISYITHPQAKPTRVTDFQNIERISTMILAGQSESTGVGGAGAKLAPPSGGSSSVTSSPLVGKKLKTSGGSSAVASSSTTTPSCNCHDIKTQLKIKVSGNTEDLAITCNGVKTADSIADLVDGYCRIVNNSDASLWDRTCMI